MEKNFGIWNATYDKFYGNFRFDIINETDLMDQYFTFHTSISHFLFSNINITNAGGIVVTCIVIGLLAVLIEVGKLWQTHLKRKANMNPLTYGHTEQNITERSPLVTPMLIPASVNQINRRWLKYHFLQTILHIGQIVLGYLVMLAVMTYNAWLFIAVTIFSGIGFYIFGAVRDYISKETEAVSLNHTDELLSEHQGIEQMEPSSSRHSNYNTIDNVRT